MIEGGAALLLNLYQVILGVLMAVCLFFVRELIRDHKELVKMVANVKERLAVHEDRWVNLGKEERRT